MTYTVAVGDKVIHVKEPDVFGKVISIDESLIDVTTCEVVWDDDPYNVDVQWTNKIRIV